MIILSQTTDILEVVLGGAVTTNQLRCVASWRDITTSSFVPDRTVIVTNGATPVNAVGSPAASTQRVVDLLNIYNLDTVAQTVTVQFNANGTRYVLISASLAAGESLQYVEGTGWAHLTAAGAVTGVASIAGTANEITASAATGAVTLSLPAALTFTGKTVTGGTFSGPTLSGTMIGSGTIGGSIVVNTSGSITGGAISGTTGTFSGNGIFGNAATGANTVTIKGGTTGAADGSALYISNGVSTIGAFGNKSSILGGGYDANAAIFAGATLNIGFYPDGSSTAKALVTSTGLNNTVIGATTPAAGSFTTLNTSGAVDINATAASATAGHLNLGSGTQTTIGANGAASALTANPLGYLKAFLGTTAIIIPYYNA